MFLASTPHKDLYARVADGSVVTIGSYDGLHIGHQKLLARVVEEAGARGLPGVVMTFEPTPKEFFAKSSPPPRLMHFREKIEALSKSGIDVFYCPRFNRSMREIRAITFIRQLLVHTLNARYLVIGDDFHFAAHREGNIELLRRAGGSLGFEVEQIPSVMVDGQRVSSTAIRAALQQGDMDKATRLLGRPFRMSGKVSRGDSIGRTLGYPTANVQLRNRRSPVQGIFAVRVLGLGDEALTGVASVGTRPTFHGKKPLLEVHIFDFDREIYGKRIEVEFVARLRDEEKFDNADALVEQMHRDSAAAREILAA